MNTEQLVEALLDPKAYPHPVDKVITIETHISVVFLTGQFAYKLKKPVNFGFLDFSSLDHRKKYCGLELKLNRRTAPQLYLDVVKIVPSANTKNLKIVPCHERADDESPVDYMVKMRQFNPSSVLANLMQQQRMKFAMVEKLSAQIADFHLSAEVVDFDSELGEPTTQLQPMKDNFPTLYSTFKAQTTLDQLAHLKLGTDTLFTSLTPLLVQRKQDGFVKACHGDLHLDNIAVIDGSPVIFDGIEFNDAFRWIDVSSDLAFLLVDLDHRGQEAASLQILSLYLSKTLDYNALYLLTFYRIYRALVRAKISSLRAGQLLAESDEHQKSKQVAQKYIDQAEHYLQKNKAPKCLLLQGVSGTGKSHFAHQLVEVFPHINAIIISSDRTRKTLYGIGFNDRVTEDEKVKLYSQEMNIKTYRAMASYAEIALQAGFNVIVDATFLKHQHRHTFYELAQQQGATAYLIHLQAKTEFTKEVIANRTKLNNNPSDADESVMTRQLDIVEKPLQSENAITLDSETLRQTFPAEIIKNFLDL